MKVMPAAARRFGLLFTTLLVLGSPAAAPAVITVFFNGSQTTNLVVSGTTSDTISSEGYLFTFTRDKLFAGGVSLTNPIGRMVRVLWPDGLEAQAVTTGPALSKARIDISREDGQPFVIESFTGRLLANTAGAGAAWEIMPLLDGEDAVPEPFMYQATGYAGSQFNYTTPELSGFDAYKITLYVDFALMKLTLIDASLPPPVLDVARVGSAVLQISWPTNATGYSLEFATSLPATAWRPVTNSVVSAGELSTVHVDIAGSERWFRLRK